ncbi:uncharacterized protein MONOS_17102 [Monocercomonoides exilis]|uniref:uncharacterized protein n=1 Tax=Monocercomonoides exilis TaxID=2049356 RepID=UPI003559E7C5|nr:hypothetical protein MONOS_17102 [Monocercomonoides exilis]
MAGLKQLLQNNGWGPYVKFIHRSLTWQNVIGYITIVIICIFDLTFVRNTELTLLTYISLLTLELYWFFGLMKHLNFLNSTNAEEEEAFDWLLAPWTAFTHKFNKFFEHEQMKELQKNPVFTPLVTSLFIMLCALIFHIFRGAFVTVVFLICVLTLPGLIHLGYDKVAYDWYMRVIYPKIQELKQKSKEAKETKEEKPQPVQETSQMS